MLHLSTSRTNYLYNEKTDMRKGFDDLSVIVISPVYKSEPDEFGIQVIRFIIMGKGKDKAVFHERQKF